MSGALTDIATALGAIVVASVLHELTHWYVGEIFHREGHIDWIRLEYRWAIPPAGVTYEDRLVSAAPVLFGCVFMLGVLLTYMGYPQELWAWAGWLWYTWSGVLGSLTGGTNDLALTIEEGAADG